MVKTFEKVDSKSNQLQNLKYEISHPLEPLLLGIEGPPVVHLDTFQHIKRLRTPVFFRRKFI